MTKSKKQSDAFHELFVALIADVERYAHDTDKENAHFRRAYVRSVFALIEGTTFRMKQLALDYNVDRLSSAEITLLQEESYSLGDTGQLRVRQAHLQCLPNVRFAFRSLAKARGIDFRPNVSGKGWEALRESVRVRDRLMHPKDPKDLLVSDEERDLVSKAFRWFVANTTLCLHAIVTGLHDALAPWVEKGVVAPTETQKRLDRIADFYGSYAE